MECNKDAAKKAMNIAERKVSEKDYNGAKKFVNKALNLFPNLDGLKQVLMMIDVYISASNSGGGREADWYGILGVDSLDDDEVVKKQYKKLALLLHPDKNKFHGAEGAFKLVLEAWCVLSDKAKRSAYDQKRLQKPPNPCKSASSNGNRNARASSGEQKAHKPSSSSWNQNADSSKQRKDSYFWTMCNRCKTQCAHLRDSHLNKAMRCSNCGQSFIATEKTPWARPPPPQNKATNKNTNSGRNSSTTSANATGKTPAPSARNQNTNGSSSWTFFSVTTKPPHAGSATPVINISSSSQRHQHQWSHSTSQNTSGGTHSEKMFSGSSVSFSYSTQWRCSNSRNTANQLRERLKRAVDESQEPRIPNKKPRTDVN